MSTIVLAKKLLSFELEQNKTEDINRLLIQNIQQKNKAAKFLKDILIQQKSSKVCRLCLRPANRNIFAKKNDFNILECIKDILNVEIHKEDCKPNHICEACYNTVQKASVLKQVAEVTQWRLQQEIEMVAASNVDSDFLRPWICKKCKRIFKTKEDLQEHESLPVCKPKQRSYVCEHCGIVMKNLSRLKTHRLVHSDVLHHACPHCPYRARTKYLLITHIHRHTGFRPIRCKLCPATFFSTSNLASHRRTHYPPSYECETCHKKFKCKPVLTNHIATQHSTHKPFECSVCEKSFATRKLIRRHELKSHNRPKMRPGPTPCYIKIQEEKEQY